MKSATGKRPKLDMRRSRFTWTGRDDLLTLLASFPMDDGQASSERQKTSSITAWKTLKDQRMECPWSFFGGGSHFSQVPARLKVYSLGSQLCSMWRERRCSNFGLSAPVFMLGAHAGSCCTSRYLLSPKCNLNKA